MSTAFFRVSLAVTVLLALGQFGLAQNGSSTRKGPQPSVTEAASDYPDAPSTVKTSGEQGSGYEEARSQKPEPAMGGGVMPTADKEYVGVMSAMFAASIVNIEQTHRCLQQHTCSFVPVPVRSRAALYGAGIPAEVGIAYVSYKLKEHGHRWWFVPAALVTAANTYVAFHSSQR